ncbi:IS1380 family transposase [uncultured Desulfobacter sp.]|uniref:IS1380 family transposase n=1 Tax=uncultured Desulfobacter sp. TaxID=240139 RepID=UPI0029F4B3AB|nr:IS1380 family transposase [uncultured Desulfobacter sp.]
MKSSKAQIYTKFHKIPEINFEERQLTSFAGVLIFQMLLKRLGLKSKLKSCFSHLKLSPIFGHHIIVLLLIVHLILGFRRIREIDYYREDPMILRLMVLKKLPDASTISRNLALLDDRSIENVRRLSRSFVISGLQRELFPRLTMDFDGSVLSTKGHAEGSAIGFNKVKKGARSYYPLFCTIAQTGQFFDMHHRPGNVHDSNGAAEFMKNCFYHMRSQIPGSILEARMGGAFFNQDIISLMATQKVQFTASVPFARFTELKKLIENCDSWTDIDDQWAFFETQWKPKSWDTVFRFVFTRKKYKKAIKGPLQLDLFEPLDREYQYKVIVTNKTESAKTVVLFHNGRGSQEAIFGNAKNDTALSVIPCKRLVAKQVFTLSSMMAHNFSQEIQMIATRHPAG